MEYRLQLMNTSQYIKQVIHKKKDKRWFNYTELFAWELEDFDLLVLADGSMYGYEKVARTIINIDPALEAEDINPWDYTTLWARYIRLNASSWIMKMRDYPREMIKAVNVAWSGTLCGAEQRGNDDINFRTNIIDPGTYFDNITVPRNLGKFS